ncbi:MAG: hypothetical protein RL272_642 [Candidatus Parcubacteria bacterium]|jgi:signal peptidase II
MPDAQVTKRAELRIAETEYRADPARPGGGNAARFWYAAALAAFALDRFLKAAVIARGESPSAWPVSFTLFRNAGIAFSLPLPRPVFWPAAGVIFAILLYLFVRSFRHDRLRAGMLAMIILGAASNLTDRYLYGSTTDYLLFFGRSAVNVADAMIVIGLAAIFSRAAGHERSSHAVKQ